MTFLLSLRKNTTICVIKFEYKTCSRTTLLHRSCAGYDVNDAATPSSKCSLRRQIHATTAKHAISRVSPPCCTLYACAIGRHRQATQNGIFSRIHVDYGTDVYRRVCAVPRAGKAGLDQRGDGGRRTTRRQHGQRHLQLGPTERVEVGDCSHFFFLNNYLYVWSIDRPLH